MNRSRIPLIIGIAVLAFLIVGVFVLSRETLDKATPGSYKVDRTVRTV